MSLKLTIYSNAKDDQTYGCSSTLVWEYIKDSVSVVDAKLTAGNDKDLICKVNLVDLSFNKQMYHPGEIYVRLQITKPGESQGNDKSFYLFTVAQLNDNFRNCQAKLEFNDAAIAKAYYVHDLVPQYTSESLYVDLKLYSPDKKLTEGKECRTFVAKRLFNDTAKSKLDALTLPFSSSTITYSIVPQNALSYKDDNDVAQEYIQPYLVQYNESFYDMLVRTANRWGEFVYFEDGKLILGREVGDEKSVSSYGSISYFNCNEDILATDNYKDVVTQNNYLGKIIESDYLKPARDLNAKDPPYSHHVFQGFLHTKDNVFNWTVNQMSIDGITAATNKKYLNKKEKEYNSTYFNNVSDNHPQYDNSKKEYRQFATYLYEGGLTAKNYKTVLDNELKAGQEMICVDLGANYQHLCVGDVFSFKDDSSGSKYLVVQATFTTDVEKYYNNGSVIVNKQWHFRVYAVKQFVTDAFYPPMLPTGHVRNTGPQRAIVVDTFDPLRNGRYRVVSSWQQATDDKGNYLNSEASPWLCVAHEMMSKNSGSVWKLEKGTEVLLDFQDGNIELPYIVGALQNDTDKAPRSTFFNNMDLTTPGGHSIRLTDGLGGGAQSFFRSLLSPIGGFIQAANPESSGIFKDKSYNKYYEGGVELTDWFGIYRIKASTDKRNITIESSYGDVTLNAFTGITISAPNGDVKIEGKNITLEAGNRINITSGKNITNGILGGGTVLASGTESSSFAWGTQFFGGLLNTAFKLIDLSIIRDALEVVFRPISGTLDIMSMRSIMLQAGMKKDDMKLKAQSDKIGKWVLSNWKTADIARNLIERVQPDNAIWKTPEFGTIGLHCITNINKYMEWFDVFGHANFDNYQINGTNMQNSTGNNIKQLFDSSKDVVVTTGSATINAATDFPSQQLYDKGKKLYKRKIFWK